MLYNRFDIGNEDRITLFNVMRDSPEALVAITSIYRGQRAIQKAVCNYITHRVLVEKDAVPEFSLSLGDLPDGYLEPPMPRKNLEAYALCVEEYRCALAGVRKDVDEVAILVEEPNPDPRKIAYCLGRLVYNKREEGPRAAYDSVSAHTRKIILPSAYGWAIRTFARDVDVAVQFCKQFQSDRVTRDFDDLLSQI